MGTSLWPSGTYQRLEVRPLRPTIQSEGRGGICGRRFFCREKATLGRELRVPRGGAGHPDAEPRSKTFCLPGFSTKLEIWAIGLLVRDWAKARVSGVRFCTDFGRG